MNKGFVNAQVDAGSPAGKDLAKKFHVRGYPTLVVVDAQGDELDRVVGYRKPDKFIPEMERILRGEGTLPALRKQAAANPDDLAVALTLAEKESNTSPEASAKRYEDIAKRAKAKGDRETEAAAVFAPMIDRLESTEWKGAGASISSFLADYSGTKAAKSAASIAVQVFPFIHRKDPAALLASLEKARESVGDDADTRVKLGVAIAQAHQKLAAKSLRDAAKAAGDDADALNEVAWTAYEQRLLLKEATGWARKAVDASKRSPMILDTLACLRALAGAYDEAITVETEAAKGAEGRMKTEFEKNIAKWKAAKDGKPVADAGDEDGEDEDGEGPDDDDEAGEAHGATAPDKK